MFRAVDDLSYNEIAEEKRKLIEDSLIKENQMKLAQSMLQMGADPESEEFQQAMSMESIMSLPQIEDFFNKTYRSMVEEWANHQLIVDRERFAMDELEDTQFVNLITFDKEVWHFNMLEDDYTVEPWDYMTVGYQASPNTRYLSNASWVAKIDFVTVADCIDQDGWLMDKEATRKLEKEIFAHDGIHDVSALAADEKYNPNKSWVDNTNLPSVSYRQYKDFVNRWTDHTDTLFDPSGTMLHVPDGMVKRTTAYWKTHRLIGHLTKVKENGELIQAIVSEDYLVTEEPIYDNTYGETKDRYNLIYGEHIDWLWINEVWGAKMINSSRLEEDPLIIGINQPKAGRLKFQFKGDSSIYGCKLPVEGWLGENSYIEDNSIVRLLTPAQLLYNMTMNQITDIQMNEFGTIIQIDHNTLPKHSMEEDWGKGNLEKAYTVMKEFGILPLDTSLQNTEGALQQNNYPILNLSQTERLMGRINLAKYYREMAFETIGITPQRLGSVTSQETATGTQAALNNSYAQTEKWFTIHSDYIMPRVHEMRTNLAQYYNSTKPSIRLQYITSEDERVNFQMNTTNLLMRDVNVFATTRSSQDSLLKNLKQLAIQDNTSGASLVDRGNILKAESIAEIDKAMKKSEKKLDRMRQEDYQKQQELLAQKIEADKQALEDKFSKDYELAKLAAETKLKEAYIKAAGYGNGRDVDQNNESDFVDNIAKMDQMEDHFNQKMSLEREKEINRINLQREHLAIQRDKVNAGRERSNIIKKTTKKD